MFRSFTRLSVKEVILWAIFSLNTFILLTALFIDNFWFLALSVTISLFILVIHHSWQKDYFPYFLKSARLTLYQYFSGSDQEGKPFSHRQRAQVYQYAKNEKQMVTTGQQEYSDQSGYEWVAHAAFPIKIAYKSLRVMIGNRSCTQPYHASILNIGAMSYGSLSKTAISSLNQGAKLGGFAHNTGEGGISEYHACGGDLIWQIGTGYFGCKDIKGNFCPELFKLNAAKGNVKMIELKLSRGTKPGYGEILPANKNTAEIADIRNLIPHTTIYSPPAHSTFSNPAEMIQFIGFLRLLADGKPVGFKLCIGDKQDFINLCLAINKTGIIPDFITIDGAEGIIGMPLYDALAFATQTLTRFGLKDEIKLLASGKILTAFDILKVLSLGASACYSARGMMFAMGCIQALKCDSGHCPAGIATQNPSLYRGLAVSDKRVKVANFHHNTLNATIKMMEAAGFKERSAITPEKFFRKIDHLHTRSFQEIYFNKTDKLKESWLKDRMLN